ncbi:MAG: hypothetical protein ACREUA_08175 [Burkholderiales bacterium]
MAKIERLKHTSETSGLRALLTMSLTVPIGIGCWLGLRFVQQDARWVGVPWRACFVLTD